MRLLLVEDDITLAATLREQLAEIGYAVDWSDAGLDAEFQGRETEYDAVILDLGLPGRPGLQVLANWRAAGIATPVLILTARDAWHERVDGLKAGADDYLGKPFLTVALGTAGIEIRVEDDGPGCPAPNLANLTQRGVRLDETVGGHRLGLAIAQEIVELYGSELALDRSQVLGGFEAVVRLPRPGSGEA